MPTPNTSDEVTCKIPISELLRGVPIDHRIEIELGECHHQFIPVGRHCHEGANKIDELERENNNFKKLIKDLQEGDYYKVHYDSVLAQWDECVKERDALKAEVERFEKVFEERCAREIEMIEEVASDAAKELEKWKACAERLAEALVDVKAFCPCKKDPCFTEQSLSDFEKLKEGL